jgi:hypothetical protein
MTEASKRTLNPDRLSDVLERLTHADHLLQALDLVADSLTYEHSPAVKALVMAMSETLEDAVAYLQPVEADNG